jgi:UDP-2,4-diacetamido-2,4,6-trideoxy-beta-L-altropyranose hydrolase
MRVGFRADASAALGFGHVARISALIEETAARGAEPIAMLGGLAATSGEWPVERVVAAVDDRGIDAVVIDGRFADELVLALAARRVRTVVIDDRGGVKLPVDAVVNHNAHAAMLADTYPRARRLLLGRRYLLLRRDITRLGRGACRPRTGARLRVVVTFGGSDPVDATSRVLSVIGDDRPLELVVIAGPDRAGKALEAAAGVAAALGHVVEIHRAPRDVAALFAGADAAIAAAGGTLGELAYLGVPTIGFAIADDQVAPARELARLGAISAGAVWAELTDVEVREQLERFVTDDVRRATIRGLALETADGHGAQRVVEEALGIAPM